MKLKSWLYVFIAAVVLFPLCAAGRKTPAPPKKEKQKEEIKLPAEASATYYYTEGLKRSLMDSSAGPAASLFRNVLKIDSTHAPSYYELANLLSANPDSAIYYSLKANRLDTNNVWYRNQLGRLMIATQRYDSALTIYNSLLKLAPNNPDNYRLLAALYEQQQQPFTAISILDSAENRFGLMNGLSEYKRQLLINVKLYDRALNEAKTIADNFPYDETNFVSLAELYAAMGKDSLALDAYEKALTINKKSVPALVSMNEYYKQKNDNQNFLATARQLFESDDITLDVKIKFFNDLIKSNDYYSTYFFQINNLATLLAAKYPLDFRVTKLYAQHLISSGKLEDALALYKAHVNDSLKNKEVFTNIMDMEAYLNRLDSVAKYSTLALEAFPSDASLYLRKGSGMSYFMKDYKGAQIEFEKALKHADTDSLKSAIYCTLGDNAQTMGDTKAAYSYYKKGLKCDSTNSVIYNNYSYFLSLKGEKLELAEQMAITANRLSPNNPTYLDTYAWVLYMMGRYEDAKTPMRQAISLDNTGSKELFVHYGDLLYKLNDPFMAAFYWKKALEKGYDAEEIEKRLKQLEE